MLCSIASRFQYRAKDRGSRNFHYYLCRQLKGGGMEINMNKKNIKNRGAKVLGTLAKKVGEFTANTKCVCIYHQPEIPEGIKKMRKF